MKIKTTLSMSLAFFLLISPFKDLMGQSQSKLIRSSEHLKTQVIGWGPLSNVQAVLKDPLLPEIAQHLQSKYGVDAIILFGSRARGAASAQSDYDILMLQNSGESKKIQEIYKNALLDISLYSKDLKKEDLMDFPALTGWEDAIILAQTHHEGEQFLHNLEDAYYLRQEEASKKIDTHVEKKNNIRLLITNLMRSLKNDVREQHHYHKYLMLALTKYFSIRNLPSKGESKSFEWLKKNDPLTYTAFEKACAPQARLEDLHHLLVRVSGPDLDKEYQDLQKFVPGKSTQEKYVLSKDPRLSDIVKQIQTDYPDVHTIILYGSRAQESATATSDYDIIALRGLGTPVKVSRDKFGETFLDIHLIPEDLSSDDFTVILSLCEGACVLLQKDHIGDDFIKKVTAVYNAGFLTLDETKQEVVNNIKGKLWKVSSRLNGQYFHHALLSDLLYHYFTLRNAYYNGSRESFRWIKKNDFPTYLAFEKALKPNASLESLNDLVDHVISPFENKMKEQASFQEMRL